MKINLFGNMAKYATCAAFAFAFTSCSDHASVVRYEYHEYEQEAEQQPSPSEVLNSSSSVKSSSSKKSTSSSSSEKGARSSSSEKAAASSSSARSSSSSAEKSFFSETWREDCLAKINEYRATENLDPLTLAPEEKQTCTDQEAADDLAENKAHGHFGNCGEGAQNSGPNFNIEITMPSAEFTSGKMKKLS